MRYQTNREARLFLVQLDRNQLRHARLLHRNPVQPIGDLHGLPAVGDDDELGVLLHALQHFHETPDVRVVQRRVDLVEDAERARLVLEDGEHQGDRGQRLLAARQQLHALQPLARRRRDDLDAALEQVGLVEQRDGRVAAAEQRAERALEILP